MATHRSVQLTPAQALHERPIRAVALRIQTTPNVMTGGTALALLYGLDRDLVGLDFDERGERVSIKNHVRDGLRDEEVPVSPNCRDGSRHGSGCNLTTGTRIRL